MRLTVIGIGRLGLSFAVCMADLGHDVLGVDIDSRKVAQVANGTVPYHEPGLQPLLHKNLNTGRLRFTGSYPEAAKFGEVHFLCVETPTSPDGSANLHSLQGAVDALAPLLDRPCLIVGRSTVPVGTARRLAGRIRRHAPAIAGVEIAWHPEFMREGSAVQDSFFPNRLVFGVASEQAAQTLRRVYARLLANKTPSLVMSLESAELAKMAANAFLATKLSFINAIAEACESFNADANEVALALSYDSRIGSQYLVPGLGYGGGCLPKDIRSFTTLAARNRLHSLAAFLGTVEEINLTCRKRTVDLARNVLGRSLNGRRVAVLGVAFKPDSDDVRDSPSLDVCHHLIEEGALVTAHDPVAAESAARIEPGVRYSETVLAAATGAELILHLTDWEEYRMLDPFDIGSVVARRNMIDARSVLDQQHWRRSGWTFYSLGNRNDLY